MKKIPAFYNTRKIFNNLENFLDLNLKKYGEFYKYKGIVNFYFTNNPDEINKIFLKSNSDYSRVNKLAKVVFNVVKKENIFFDDMEGWKPKRIAMNPFFEKKNVANHYGLMKAKTAEIIDEVEKKIGSDVSKSIDVYDFCNELIIKITLEAFFGKDSGKKDFYQIMSWINDLRDYLSKAGLPIISNIALNPKARKARKEFGNYIKELIELRRKGEKYSDNLLDYIIEVYSTKKENGQVEIDEEGIIQEIFLVIFAGYETSSATATWMFYLLGKNPEKYKKLQQEIEDEFKGQDPSPEKIVKLKYVDQVLSEVLRVNVAPWILLRSTTKEVEISGETLKKDSTVMVCPHFAHLDEKHWDDPKKFIPERWEKDNAHNINKKSYMPFGAGPRKCIGMEFSIAEMKIMMVMMLSKFKFSIDPEFKVKTVYGFTANPDKELKMIMEKIN